MNVEEEDIKKKSRQLEKCKRRVNIEKEWETIKNIIIDTTDKVIKRKQIGKIQCWFDSEREIVTEKKKGKI